MHSELKSKTAVLYFTLSPEAQALEKSFASGHGFQTNVTIATLLRDHTCHQISRSGLPLILFDEQTQTGDSFGEKITRAFMAVFDAGYENVIVVGNDTPQLKSRHLVQASDSLENGTASIVLGPSVDGGTWLMGFNRDAFHPETIKSLPWNTSRLYSSIIEQHEPIQIIQVLELFQDIDHTKDLHLFLNQETTDGTISCLRRTISRLLDTHPAYTDFDTFTPVFGSYDYSFLLRGPPSTSDDARPAN